MKIHLRFLSTSILILSGLFINSCKSDDNNSDNPDSIFNTPEMLSDITTDVILPSISDFKDKAIALEESILSFTSDQTEEKLIAAQNQWKETAKSYANIYVFNIGRPKELFMHELLFNWPTFTEDIDKTISQNLEINIETISTRAKGHTGIEYLLFEKTDAPAADILVLFSSTPKRTEYLNVIATNLKEKAIVLSDIWNENGENYSNTFITNTETGLQGSLNMIFNGMFNVAETIKKAKLGKPAGLENTASTNPNILEAFRSKISLSLIENNIRTIEKVYFNSANSGISDNVEFITKNSTINDRIKAQFDLIYEALNKITIPLHLAIDQQKEPVEEAYNAIKTLVVLLNNEVGSTLSIIITPTDNDGD
ncbi:imelysin family protein [Aquimarina sediminis]|uniref:imelysin family protein n=1 Tax=Aquimarina sediminis TaxID=2070536 RepID=UPI000CA04E86|nr:imelysin family protein [Aquimarina sediminis]